MNLTEENIFDFTDRFKDDALCLEYLSDYKWREGYSCRKCGHIKYIMRTKN